MTVNYEESARVQNSKIQNIDKTTFSWVSSAVVFTVQGCDRNQWWPNPEEVLETPVYCSQKPSICHEIVTAVCFRSPENKLKGLVVWVTGASSGIGEELAYQLAKCGSRLILSARREDELKRVKRRCLECSDLQSDDILVLTLDLLERSSHEEKTEAVIQHFGHIDILINNGGRSQCSIAVETSIDVYQAVMELNFLGTVSITKQVLIHMTQQGYGSIVTVSSIAGFIGVPLLSGYSASKHALQGFLNSLRTELTHYPNILISIVCPGPVISNIIHNSFTEELDRPLADAGNQDHKMPTSRCVRLMLIGIANGVNEMWIMQQPFLLLSYLMQYTPTFGHFIASKAGRKMIQNFKAGRDADSAYSTKSKTS